MKKTKHVLLTSLLFSVSLYQTACTQRISDSDTALYLDKSATAATELQKALGPQLKSAIAEGGPAHALEVCKQVAQPTTTLVSQGKADMLISRTALRVRNPLNAPDAHSRDVLAKWEKAYESGNHQLEASIDLIGKEIVVHRPIVMQEVCLKCHGSEKEMDPALLAELERLYPDDQATDYELGEVRGAFRIVFSQ